MRMVCRVKREARQLVRALLYFLYPPVCLDCGRLFEPVDDNIYYCPECWSRLPLITEERCPRCLERLSYELPEGCATCVRRDFSFDFLYSAAEFHGIVREALHRFKFSGMRRLASPLSRLIVLHIADDFDARNYDYLLAVPLHWRRRLARGYNQAEDLAACLGKQWHLPIAKNALKRNKSTRPLATLNYQKRARVIKNCFEVCDFELVRDKTFLLVDDITTGRYTLNECAYALKNAGARRVDGVTVAVSAF